MEKWDAYDCCGHRTGEILVRGAPIPKDRYHLVCEVLVRHVDGSVLCMLRDRSKTNYSGWYEATAGGSALLGETPMDCARRELLEETGIDRGEFTLLNRIVSERQQSIFYVYLCTVEWDKSKVTLQQGETEDWLWMEDTSFGEFVRSDRMIPNQKVRFHDYFVSCGYLNE